MPPCIKCGKDKTKKDFSNTQWKRSANVRKCKVCSEQRRLSCGVGGGAAARTSSPKTDGGGGGAAARTSSPKTNGGGGGGAPV